MPASPSGEPQTGGAVRRLAPGLALVALVALAGRTLSEVVPVSPLVLAMLGGVALANTGLVGPWAAAGSRFAATALLRVGVVLLGLRVSLGDLASLGLTGLAAITAAVATTFLGTRWLAAKLGIRENLGVLVASGYAVCGASAIAAVNGVVDADEEDAAYAVGLVTVFGSLSVLALPALADRLGMPAVQLGVWSGAAVHDVAQVVATASTAGSVALTAAVIVKLFRVALLAPVVAVVGAARRSPSAGRQPAIPWFVAGFFAAVVLASTGLLPPSALGAGNWCEGVLLSAAVVGLGLGVRLSRLRRVGYRPLLLGAASWALVGGAGLAVAHVVHLGAT